MLRSSSCSSAGLASDTKPEVHLTPLREVIVRDAPRPLAPTGRLPLGLFPPCSPSTSKRTCAGLRELLPTSDLGPTAHSDPNLAPPPAPPESTWDRPFSGLHYTALTAPGPELAPALSTSPTCSTSRAGFTQTRSMRRCPHYFAGSPQARCLPPPGGSHARGSAGNARRMANRAPLRWASSSAQPTPSAS